VSRKIHRITQGVRRPKKEVKRREASEKRHCLVRENKPKGGNQEEKDIWGDCDFWKTHLQKLRESKRCNPGDDEFYQKQVMGH